MLASTNGEVMALSQPKCGFESRREYCRLYAVESFYHCS